MGRHERALPGYNPYVKKPTDDGKVDGNIKVHLPKAKRCLKNESEIRSAMATSDSIIVSHNEYDVRYDIVEIIL